MYGQEISQYGKKEYLHLGYGIVFILGTSLLAKGCQDRELRKGIAGASAKVGGLESKLDVLDVKK